MCEPEYGIVIIERQRTRMDANMTSAVDVVCTGLYLVRPSLAWTPRMSQDVTASFCIIVCGSRHGTQYKYSLIVCPF